jgi:hypothetical protein
LLAVVLTYLSISGAYGPSIYSDLLAASHLYLADAISR